MDQQLISIALRLCILGTFLLPMFPWPKPNYAPEHTKQTGQLFSFFIFLVAAGGGMFLASLYYNVGFLQFLADSWKWFIDGFTLKGSPSTP